LISDVTPPPPAPAKAPLPTVAQNPLALKTWPNPAETAPVTAPISMDLAKPL